MVYLTAIVSSSYHVTSDGGTVVSYELGSVCEEELTVLHIGSLSKYFYGGTKRNY